MLSALGKIHGVRNVVATGARDGDAYAYNVESDKGIDVRKPMFNLCASKSWPIVGLMPIGTDLETIFIRLVDRSNGVDDDARSSKKRSRAH